MRFKARDLGTSYYQFKGDAKGAVEFLMQKKEGQAIAALYHDSVGYIDLPWGYEGTGKSDGFGLSKLVNFHPEVVKDLQGIIDSMSEVSRSSNRVNLESDQYKAGIRLTWNDESKTWLLTLFEKKNSVSDNTTDTVGTSNGSERNDTATPQNTVSDGKDTNSSENSRAITFDNFYENTNATFHQVDRPEGELDYVSYPWSPSAGTNKDKVSSEYWYREDENGKYVVRGSNHWSTDGRLIGTCDWRLIPDATKSAPWVGKAEEAGKNAEWISNTFGHLNIDKVYGKAYLTDFSPRFRVTSEQIIEITL